MRLAFRVGDVGPRPDVTKSKDKSCLVEKGSGGVLPLLVHVSTHETCVFNGYHFAVSVWGCGTPAGVPAAQAHVMATAISPDRRCECRCCSLLTDKRAASFISGGFASRLRQTNGLSVPSVLVQLEVFCVLLITKSCHSPPRLPVDLSLRRRSRSVVSAPTETFRTVVGRHLFRS